MRRLIAIAVLTADGEHCSDNCPYMNYSLLASSGSCDLFDALLLCDETRERSGYLRDPFCIKAQRKMRKQ